MPNNNVPALHDLEDMQKKDEFLALLAHELRNPLSPIVMATQIIKRAGIANPAVQQSIVTIERQVVQLTRLVDDLTDMARLTNGKIKLQIQPLRIDHVCDGAVESVQAFIDTKHHKLVVEMLPVCMTGDPVRLQQVVANLLNNAVKFTQNGGTISLKVTEEKETVTIIAQDNGVGIGATALNQVCDMYFQESRMSGSGLGIGLALTRTLVEMHGGTLEIQSEGKGCGTSATVKLPLRASVQRENKHVCVLVIDDNIDHANNLSILLEMEDYQCRVAYDGATGLKELENYKPDVIFLDIGMPDMDGYQVIAAMEKDNRPYVVAVTGFGQPGDKAKTKAAGFDDHLVKPPQAQEIFMILHKIAERKSTS